MAESIAVQLTKILDEYSKEVVDAANNSISKVSRQAVTKLRGASPKRTGSYAKGWGTKTEGGIGGIRTIIVHNKTDYQLTHLLERGHVIRNKKRDVRTSSGSSAYQTGRGVGEQRAPG